MSRQNLSDVNNIPGAGHRCSTSGSIAVTWHLNKD